MLKRVHGDIRHLENLMRFGLVEFIVHGDIRHLEKMAWFTAYGLNVHGDIRHLEMSIEINII